MPTRLAPLVLALLLSAGCQHVGTQMSARTLDAGRARMSAGLGAGIWVDEDQVFLAPAFQARLQYGITDQAEFGVTGGTDGLGGQLKLAMIRSPSPVEGWSLSFLPGLSVGPSTWGSDPYGLRSTMQLPMLVGYRFAGHELTLGPRFLYVSTMGVRNAQAVFGGTTLGATLRFGSLTVSPELGVMSRLLWAGNVPTLIPVANLGFGWE